MFIVEKEEIIYFSTFFALDSTFTGMHFDMRMYASSFYHLKKDNIF